jgi:prepilin-type N-terminal cleavage/methylation domain-containing protein
MTRRRMASPRAGFTLAELLVGMVVAAVVGTALVRIMVSETGAFSSRDATRNARAVARGGLNLLSSELSMVETTAGVEAASADGSTITIRVPYAMGIMCSSTGSVTTVSMLPADSSLYFAPGFSGFAWRTSAGNYTYVTAGTSLNNSGTTSNCTAASVAVTTLPAPGSVAANAGRVVSVAGTVAPVPAVGTPFLLFRRITYQFKASVALPGRIGLWRTVLSTGAAQELEAPFDATSRFRFFVLNNPVAQAAVPASLADIRGLEIEFDGQSEGTPRGAAGPTVVQTATAIFFRNRPD